MWIVEDKLLHTESCPSKVLLKEVKLTQLLPCLLITHKPATKEIICIPYNNTDKQANLMFVSIQ
jgi:hypothetical protein